MHDPGERLRDLQVVTCQGAETGFEESCSFLFPLFLCYWFGRYVKGLENYHFFSFLASTGSLGSHLECLMGITVHLP
jgi:hypothetical protein